MQGFVLQGSFLDSGLKVFFLQSARLFLAMERGGQRNQAEGVWPRENGTSCFCGKGEIMGNRTNSWFFSVGNRHSLALQNVFWGDFCEGVFAHRVLKPNLYTEFLNMAFSRHEASKEGKVPVCAKATKAFLCLL